MTPAHHRTLDALAGRLIPPPAGDAGYGWPAGQVALGRLVDDALSEASPRLRGRLAQLLSAFDHPLAMLLLAGRPQPLSRMSAEEAEAALRALSVSALPVKRQAFQTLKRLIGFVYFSHTDGGRNPTWPAIGYAPVAPGQPHAARALRTVTPPPGGSLEAEVCVIGSGAGGGVAAATLAAAGRDVLIIEKGPYLSAADFRDDEGAMVPALYLDRGSLATDDLGMILLAGRCVGGGTVVNWCTCFRPPEPLLHEWATAWAIADLLESGFEAEVRGVEQRLHVTRDQSVHNGNNRMLLAGLKALGYHHETIARNVTHCGDCTGCWYGCRSGSKQSTLRTYLQDASDGGARLAPGTEVWRLVTDGRRAVSAECRARSAEGRPFEVTVRAKAFVLAAGAVHTPAILLRSGLAAPHVGRHLRLHPVTPLFGRFRERVEFWRGVPQSVYSDQFAMVDGPFGFKLETAPANPGLAAAALPWTSGGGYKDLMTRLPHLANIIVLTRDRGEGRVTVDRDGYPVVSYFPAPADRALLQRGLVEAARVHLAAGAEEVLTTHLPVIRAGREEGEAGFRRFEQAVARQGIQPNRQMLYSAHLMGTMRMGGRRGDAAVSPEGRLWDLDNVYVADASLFPSASGVNPMITIMAMASRIARMIAAAAR